MKQSEVTELLEEIERIRRFDEAVMVWGGVVGAALLADIALVSRGKRTLSSAARDNWHIALGLTAVVALHIAGKLGRYDPFSFLDPRRFVTHKI